MNWEFSVELNLVFCCELCYLTMFILEPGPDLVSHHENNVFQLFINLGLLKQIYGANYTHSLGQKEDEKLHTLPVSHLCLQIKKKKKSGWWTDRKIFHTETQKKCVCYTNLNMKPVVHGALCRHKVGPVFPIGSDHTLVILWCISLYVVIRLFFLNVKDWIFESQDETPRMIIFLDFLSREEI